MAIYIYSEDRCVMCGQIVPEGRMVCPMCEKDVEERTAQKQSATNSKDISRIAWAQEAAAIPQQDGMR